MSAQRANDITDDDRRAGEEAIATVRRLRAEIAAANPDMTDEDWERFANEWAEAVDDGLRRHVRRQRGELEPVAT